MLSLRQLCREFANAFCGCGDIPAASSHAFCSFGTDLLYFRFAKSSPETRYRQFMHYIKKIFKEYNNSYRSYANHNVQTYIFATVYPRYFFCCLFVKCHQWATIAATERQCTFQSLSLMGNHSLRWQTRPKPNTPDSGVYPPRLSKLI